jgi:hypothetical protein
VGRAWSQGTRAPAFAPVHHSQALLLQQIPQRPVAPPALWSRRWLTAAKLKKKTPIKKKTQ